MIMITSGEFVAERVPSGNIAEVHVILVSGNIQGGFEVGTVVTQGLVTQHKGLH
jgi:hypothetical protein